MLPGRRPTALLAVNAYLEAAALRWAAEDRGPGGSRVAGVIAAAMKPQNSQMTMKVVIPYPGSVAAKCTSDCPPPHSNPATQGHGTRNRISIVHIGGLGSVGMPKVRELTC